LLLYLIYQFLTVQPKKRFNSLQLARTGHKNPRHVPNLGSDSGQGKVLRTNWGLNLSGDALRSFRLGWGTTKMAQNLDVNQRESLILKANAKP